MILLVVFAGIPYETWTAIAGSTIYMKFIFDFIVSRHAHPILGKDPKGSGAVTSNATEGPINKNSRVCSNNGGDAVGRYFSKTPKGVEEMEKRAGA